MCLLYLQNQCPHCLAVLQYKSCDVTIIILFHISASVCFHVVPNAADKPLYLSMQVSRNLQD